MGHMVCFTCHLLFIFKHGHRQLSPMSFYWQVPWTEALRSIVKNCYRHHGRDDLLNIFGGESTHSPTPNLTNTILQTITNPDGTVSVIQIDPGSNTVVTLPDGSQATVVQAVNNVSRTDCFQFSCMV